MSRLGVGSNDQHPDHDISAGEQYYKDIYEAIRSSPAWESTLFVITYDEHGGFYDHVVPPLENILRLGMERGRTPTLVSNSIVWG